MKVLMVDPSGFSIPYDRELCEALGRSGHEVVLASRRPRAQEHLKPEAFRLEPLFYRASEQIRSRGLRRLVKGLEHFWDLRRLERWIERERPDVVHFQWLALPALDLPVLRRLKGKTRLILTVHNSTIFHGSASSRLQILRVEEAMRVFDRFVVHTARTREFLLGLGIEASRISVIPHGVLPLQEGDREWARTNPFSKRTILFFGNVKPYKGVDLLLKAFAGIPAEQRKGWQVFVAGSGEPRYIQELKGLARVIGLVEGQHVLWDSRFLSEPEIARYLRHADFAVFPYREIDASGALKAALPFGRPILASAVGEFALVAAENPSVRLFPPESVEDLRSELKELMASDAGRGLSHETEAPVIRLKHQWGVISDKTHYVYNSAP